MGRHIRRYIRRIQYIRLAQGFPLLFLAAATVTACGFQPLYQAEDSTPAMRAALAEVEVSPIGNDRLGQVMRNSLIQKLGGAGGRYRLDIALEEARELYGIRPDAAAQQEELKLTATMVLTPAGGEDAVIDERMTARMSYDLVQSDFAIVTQREDAARRLALDLAERIHRRLALYFSKREEAS